MSRICPCCRRAKSADCMLSLSCVHSLCSTCLSLIKERRRCKFICPFCHLETKLDLRKKPPIAVLPRRSQHEGSEREFRAVLAQLARRRSMVAAIAEEAENARMDFYHKKEWSKKRLKATSELLWRLHLLRQCGQDLDELVEGAKNALHADSHLISRLILGLEAVSKTLRRLDDAKVVHLDLSSTLYEKVTCTIPVNGPIRGDLAFILSVNGLPLPEVDVQTVEGNCLRFVPPFAGRASLRAHSSSFAAVDVRPHTFSIRALTLEEYSSAESDLIAL